MANTFPEKYTVKSETLINNQTETIESKDKNFRDSAIVVLTGAKGRFEKGYLLLEANISSKLFISGLYHGVDLKKKYGPLVENKQMFDCCIFYGNDAFNTEQNAYEVERWAKSNGVKKIFVVSSYYHLPRTKVIFEKNLVGVEIILVPSDRFLLKSHDMIFNLFNLRLIILEYFKTLYTLFVH